jgi:hypothetical protein
MFGALARIVPQRLDACADSGGVSFEFLQTTIPSFGFALPRCDCLSLVRLRSGRSDRAGASSVRRLHIETEEICRIVLGLEFGQPRVIASEHGSVRLFACVAAEVEH